jgi:hypothetical protein
VQNLSHGHEVHTRVYDHALLEQLTNKVHNRFHDKIGFAADHVEAGAEEASNEKEPAHVARDDQAGDHFDF